MTIEAYVTVCTQCHGDHLGDSDKTATAYCYDCETEVETETVLMDLDTGEIL